MRASPIQCQIDEEEGDEQCSLPVPGSAPPLCAGQAGNGSMARMVIRLLGSCSISSRACVSAAIDTSQSGSSDSSDSSGSGSGSQRRKGVKCTEEHLDRRNRHKESALARRVRNDITVSNVRLAPKQDLSKPPLLVSCTCLVHNHQRERERERTRYEARH
jgi:hypothetical protein